MKKTVILIMSVIYFNTLSAGTPEIKWWFDTFDSSFGQSAMDDIDNDGKYEIVFGCYRNDSSVYAINAEDGTLLWKFNTSGTQEGCNDTAPVIFDADSDGDLDVIVPGSCNPFTYCFEGKTGELKWKTPTRGSDSPPSISDIDGDGDFEILHGEFGGYVICINAKSGVIEWELAVDTNSWIQTAPTVTDLDNDGDLDFVAATWNNGGQNKLYAYRGKDRILLWSLNLDDVVYHGTLVTDIDKDGKNELVLGDYSGKLWVVNAEDGTVAWSFKSTSYIGSPVVGGDLDGDGSCDMVFSSLYTIFAFRADGTKLWEYEMPDYGQSFRGAALSDIDDDGLPDVIFGTSMGRLIALKGTNGGEIINMNLAEHIGKSFDINHAPVIGDFDNDGILDAFVVGGHTDYPDFTGNYGMGYAVSLGKGKGPDWKMFQQNIRRTGCICGTNANVADYNIKNPPVIKIDNLKDIILISSLQNRTKADFFNILGEKVLSVNLENEENEIDISFLPNGFYIIRIGNFSEKFVNL